jgi:hypothetical protein
VSGLHPISHVGILVGDLELASRRWAAVLGSPVSPVFRYRSSGWSDADNPLPHTVDLRQAISYCTGAWFQILEYAPTTVHGSRRAEGGHHLGFAAVSDGGARGRELVELGFTVTARSEQDGRRLIQFTEPNDLDSVFTEWVEASPLHLNLKDDGAPLDRLADGSASVFGPAIADAAEPPPSGLDEVGIIVGALETSIARWASITGDAFVLNPDDTSAVSSTISPRIRLVARVGGAAPGIAYVALLCADAAAKRAELTALNVPLRPSDDAVVEVEPDFLNGLSVLFRDR